MEQTGELKQQARALGLQSIGVAEAGPSPHRGRYLEWLAAGRHGTMSYMARQVAQRTDPRRLLPGARSIVVVTLPYPDEVPFPHRGHGKISRYARGRDYHKVLRPPLKKLAEFISAGGRWRCWHSVDTGPILERDWAEAAGVGWIGKNGLVIDKELGSWCFLGVLVTDRAYLPDAPATDHCGTCRACLDACPTGAIFQPRSVDARRCISYLTIEHRGPIQDQFRGQLHGWVFGCDICQEVCPYNTRALRPRSDPHPDFTPRPLPEDLRELAALDDQEFHARFSGTAVTRTGRRGLVRNARFLLEEETH